VIGRKCRGGREEVEIETNEKKDRPEGFVRAWEKGAPQQRRKNNYAQERNRGLAT